MSQAGDPLHCMQPIPVFIPQSDKNCASSPGCVADISKVIPLPFPLSFLVRFLGHFADTQTFYWLYGDTGRKTEAC